MKVCVYSDIESEEAAPGVSRRVVVGAQDGAPTFAMRVFEINPGSSTPYHQHPWEHGVYALSGEGVVRSKNGEKAITGGSVVYVAPDEEHCFANTGNSLLRMICVVPVENN